MDDFIQFVAMVLIFTIIAVFTWVRKLIEKAQQEQGKEKGQPVDVGKAVREQLKKYMQAAGQLPPDPPRPAPEAPPPQARPAPAEPLTRPEPAPPRPAVVVPAKSRRLVPARAAKKAAVERRRPPRFTAKDVRRAVLNAEILAPPVSMREDYRLF